MEYVLFGGGFDPIHNGHIDIAKLCKQNIKNIDEIWFIPTYKSYIKNIKTDYNDRCNMISLSIKDYEYMTLKKFEEEFSKKNYEEYSYTCNLIKNIKNIYTNDKLYFLCGLDSILEIKTWHNYEYILSNIEFIICNRKYNENYDSIKQYKKYFDELTKKYNFKYKIINNNNIDISSTKIRNCIKENNGAQIKNCINNDVYQYILDKGLYK